jgi:hypothetical protein
MKDSFCLVVMTSSTLIELCVSIGVCVGIFHIIICHNILELCDIINSLALLMLCVFPHLKSLLSVDG